MSSHQSTPQLDLWQVNLTHQFGAGDTAFNLSIQFESCAQRIALIGPSGAGKSQTLMMMAGLVKPREGLVRFKDRIFIDTSKKINLSPQQRHVSYMFQDYALFEHLTVAQNIGFALHRGLCNPSPSLQKIDPAVTLWLERLEMLDASSKYPKSLSGGQKQRVALARSLIHRPDALLLDEPFAALDQTMRSELIKLLIEVQTDLNLPMIFITHDTEDVANFAQEIIHVKAGRVIRMNTQHDK